MDKDIMLRLILELLQIVEVDHKLPLHLIHKIFHLILNILMTILKIKLKF